MELNAALFNKVIDDLVEKGAEVYLTVDLQRPDDSWSIFAEWENTTWEITEIRDNDN